MKRISLLLPVLSFLIISAANAAGNPQDTLIEKANFQSGNYDYWGFKSLTEKPLQVWPNPAKDWVRVSVNSIKPGDTGECVIYNSNGVISKRQIINSGTNEVNTANLQSGTYFVEVISRNRNIDTEKIIVKH